jgi:hypothetical protein
VAEAKALLTVTLHSEAEDLVVEIGSAKWLGKAAAGVGVAVVWVPGLAIAAVAAAGGWRRYKLMAQTIKFLRETAPTHVRSEP